MKDLEITKSAKLVEVQRPDLVASFLGQTASQTKACIERAEGGVLFVDEAYRLKVDPRTITEKKHWIPRWKPTQMEEFMKLNPGFKRRIRAIFVFDDFTCEELTEIFMRKLQSRGFNTDIIVQELGNLIALHTTEDFRKAWNAGFCDLLFQLAKESLDERLCSDSFGEVKDDESELSQVSKEDIQKAIGMNFS